MTNQQAIEFLKIERDHMTPTVFTERVEAMDMAISALQAQEAKNSTESSSTHKALDTISRQAAIDIASGYAEQLNGYIGTPNDSEVYAYARGLLLSIQRNIDALTSTQPDVPDINVGDMISREELFEELNCINLPVGNETVDKIFSVIENMPSAQPEIIYCKDCKHFELDHFEKVEGFPVPIIVAHEICMKWSDGCRTSKDGWCFMAERRTDEQTDKR